MDIDESSIYESDYEFESELSPSTESSSGSIPTRTLDSGLSSGTWTTSDTGWSSDANNFDTGALDSTDSTYCIQNQTHLISHAVQYLCFQDIPTLLGSSAYLFHLCRTGHSEALIEFCPELLSHMLPAIRFSCSKFPDIAHFLSGIMHYICYTECGADLILSTMGVEIVSIFLASTVESVLFYTLTALHSLLIMHKRAADVFRNSKITSLLVGLLKTPLPTEGEHCEKTLPEATNPKFLAILCDSLHILAYGHEKTKCTFLELDAVRYLIRLLCFTHHEKLLWTALRLLRVLSAYMPIKLEVVSRDPAMVFLTHCLSVGSFRVTASAMWTLRNLSDVIIDKLTSSEVNAVANLVITQLKNSLDFLDSPSSFLHSAADYQDRLNLCRCVLDIIGNLTCGNVGVKNHLVNLNCIGLILKVSHLASSKMERRRQRDRSPSVHHLEATKKSTQTYQLSHSSNFVHLNTPSIDPTTQSLLPHPATRGLHDSHQRSLDHLMSHACSNPVTFSAPFNRNDIMPVESIDLLDAAFRCLSHLSTGQRQADNVLTCFMHQRCSHQIILDTVERVVIPLLTQNPYFSRSIPQKQLPKSLCDTGVSRALHLLKSWCTFLNNMSSIFLDKSFCRLRKNREQKKSRGMKLCPTTFLSHLRRNLRLIFERLSRLIELASDSPQDLLALHRMVRLVSEKFSMKTISRPSPSIARVNS